MKKYISEGIGTFFLMLTTVLASSNIDVAAAAPLAIGATLTMMVYAGAHISGAHFNPAVTLSSLMRGKIDRTDAFYYPIAQVAGAVLAAVMAAFLLRCGLGTDTQMHAHKSGICSVVAEFIGAFAWIYVVLNTSSEKNQTGYNGMVAGLALAAMIYALGGISGGLFNPAIAIGGILAGMVDFSDIWVFLIGDLLGAAAAVTVFQILSGSELQS